MKKQESWKNSDLKTESSGKLFFRTKNHWRALMKNQDLLENSDVEPGNIAITLMSKTGIIEEL